MNKTISLIKNVVIVFCLVFVFCFATKSQAASVIKTNDEEARDKIASIAEDAGCYGFSCHVGNYEVSLFVDPVEYSKVFEDKKTEELFDFLSKVVDEAEPQTDLFSVYWAVIEPYVSSTATPKPEKTPTPTISPKKVKEILSNTITEKIGEVANKLGYKVITKTEGSTAFFYEEDEVIRIRTTATKYKFGIISPSCWIDVFSYYNFIDIQDIEDYIEKTSRNDVFIIERTVDLTEKEIKDYEYYSKKQKKYIIQNGVDVDDVDDVKVDVQNADDNTEPVVAVSIGEIIEDDTQHINAVIPQPRVTVQSTSATKAKAIVKSIPTKKASVKKVSKTKKTKNKKIKTKKIKNKKIKSKKTKNKKAKR